MPANTATSTPTYTPTAAATPADQYAYDILPTSICHLNAVCDEHGNHTHTRSRPSSPKG